VVVEALGERKAKAYLFGSYARGDATARSDLDIAVIVEKMPEDLLGEMAELNSAVHEALGSISKEIDLLLVDEKTFDEHKAKSWDGSVYNDVHREGIRLV
jgi:predicted nucleotidyltransferase